MEYGLSETEARTYLALLQHAELNAGTLAKIARVPRSHLYTVLQDLHARSLVEIRLDGSTRAYRAKPFAVYLRDWITSTRVRAAEIEQSLPEVEAAFVPPSLDGAGAPSAGNLRVVLSRRAVAREIDDLLGRAQERVFVAGTVGGFERVLRHMRPYAGIWTNASGALRLDVDIVVPTHLRRTGGVERLGTPLAARVRWIDLSRATLTVMVDDTEMLIVHPIPDNGDYAVGRDFATHTTDAAFIHDHVDALMALAPDRNVPGTRSSSATA